MDTLYLTINHSDETTESITACDSFAWHGTTYYATTFTPTYTTINALGCDSTVTLNLTIRQSTHNTQSVTACDSYIWHEINYTTSGTYTYDYTNTDGCPSSDTLHLSVVHATHQATIVTACDSLRWHDSLYTVSGTYTYHYTNTDNVASCDTLHLTVGHTYSFDNNVSACDSFRWDANGTIYTVSLSDTLYLNTSLGCDSVYALQLVLYHSYETQEMIHACDSFVWEQNYRCYFHDASDTVRYVGMGGCDSVFVILLTIDTSRHYLLDTTLCGSFYWPVTDSLYHQSTGEQISMSTATGCDSTITLQLTLHPIDTTILTDTLCKGSSLVWHDLLCDHTDNYRYDTLNRNGCDSIIQLQLTLVEPPSVVAHAAFDCAQQWYHLTATTTAPYVVWYAQPADSAGLLPSSPDAFARPLTDVEYMVRADLRDTLFCPAYDTLVLQPALHPSALISTRPEMLTESNLTLYATALCRNAHRMHWLVNDRWYAENCANITYHADPMADSVRLAVVVEGSFCADTVTHVVPIHHEVLYVPNIFLPEGDDDELRLFRVHSNTVTEFEMTVYTRGGIPVFRTTDLDTPWDGTSNGAPCPQGAYLYNIRYRVPSVPDNWKTRIGTVTLVR